VQQNIFEKVVMPTMLGNETISDIIPNCQHKYIVSAPNSLMIISSIGT